MTDKPYAKICILTGSPGENVDDCTTHDHEDQNASTDKAMQTIDDVEVKNDE